MKKIKAFIYVFIKSLTSPKYYSELIQTNLSFSIKYFLVLIAFLSIALSISFTVDIFKGTPENKFTQFVNQAKNAYPDDLVITSKDGRFIINKPKPYSIPTPNFLTSETSGQDIKDAKERFPKNLITFDSNGTVDDLKKYETLILINDVNILAQNKDKVETTPLKNIREGEFNKEKFDKIMDQFDKLLKILPYIVFIFISIGITLLTFIFRLIYLLLVGLVLMMMGKTKGLNLNFIKYYKIGLHAATLPLVIDTVINAFNISFFVPLWFFVLNVIFGIVVVTLLAQDVESGKDSKVTTEASV